MAGFRGDDRGVSEVLGAIMVFGLVLTIIALVQIHAVPAANANVEANHLEVMEEDLGQLQGAISRTATGSAGEAVRLNLGTQYPSRFILVNPPPVAGEIRTGPARPVILENASALDDETRDYLNASTSYEFETRSIIYTPDYNELDTPGSTVFEPGVRYKRFPGGENVQEKGMLVNGRTITIVTVDGNLSETAVTSSTLSTVPLSSTRFPTAIEGTGNENVTIRVPTNLSENSWRNRVLDEQLDGSGNLGNDRFVHNVSCANATRPADQPCDDNMVITMEEDSSNSITYNLRLAKVGVGSGYSQVDEHYVVDVQGHNESVPENGTQKLIVEVRDRFNNPVSGAELTVVSPSHGSISPMDRLTDADGRAEFVYEAPDDVSSHQQVTIDVGFATSHSPATNNTEIDVLVMDMDGSANIINVVCNSFPQLCPGGTPGPSVPVN